MNIKNLKILIQHFSLVGIVFLLNSCTNTVKVPNNTDTKTNLYPSAVFPLFNEFKLILGDGSNVGYPISFMLQMMKIRIG
jgi:hypothetical protein